MDLTLHVRRPGGGRVNLTATERTPASKAIGVGQRALNAAEQWARANVVAQPWCLKSQSSSSLFMIKQSDTMIFQRGLIAPALG